MKILAELSEKSLGINEYQQIVGETYTLRKSARAIVLNSEGLMALHYIQKYNYHMLPGGGMEVGRILNRPCFEKLKKRLAVTLLLSSHLVWL